MSLVDDCVLLLSSSAETCGLDDVFRLDDLGSCPEALCWYIYISMCIPYMSSFIGRIYVQRECHSVLAKLHPITFYRIVFLGSARFLGWMPFVVFFGLPIVSCSLIKSDSRMLVTFAICFKQHFDTRYLVFYNPSLPRMFLSLDLLWEYRIQHGVNGPFYVTSTYSTWIFCREFQALQVIVLAAFGIVD